MGTAATKGDGTWIGTISARDGKLIQPKSEFLEKVKIMENMFLCHHGDKNLKHGKGVIELLTGSIRNSFNSDITLQQKSLDFMSDVEHSLESAF